MGHLSRTWQSAHNSGNASYCFSFQLANWNSYFPPLPRVLPHRSLDLGLSTFRLGYTFVCCTHLVPKSTSEPSSSSSAGEPWLDMNKKANLGAQKQITWRIPFITWAQLVPVERQIRPGVTAETFQRWALKGLHVATQTKPLKRPKALKMLLSRNCPSCSGFSFPSGWARVEVTRVRSGPCKVVAWQDRRLEWK